MISAYVFIVRLTWVNHQLLGFSSNFQLRIRVNVHHLYIYIYNYIYKGHVDPFKHVGLARLKTQQDNL